MTWHGIWKRKKSLKKQADKQISSFSTYCRIPSHMHIAVTIVCWGNKWALLEAQGLFEKLAPKTSLLLVTSSVQLNPWRQKVILLWGCWCFVFWVGNENAVLSDLLIAASRHANTLMLLSTPSTVTKVHWPDPNWVHFFTCQALYFASL